MKITFLFAVSLRGGKRFLYSDGQNPADYTYICQELNSVYYGSHEEQPAD